MKYWLFLILFNTMFASAQVTGTLSGIVVDEKETPIVGASVILEGTTKGAQTDIDGKYTINDIPPGTYNITASYLGYSSSTLFNVLIKSVGNASYNFTLTERTETLDQVILSNANRINRNKETPLSTQTLSATEIATYPGSNNDVVQVAQTLPGVSPSIGGFRNDLIIRGGAPNETVYYLDGIEVPNINHFSTQGSAGGPVGMVNVSFISDVTLSTSAFGVEYDNPLSGVLQFKQRNGNASQFAGNFRLSASEAALTLEGPLFKTANSSESKTTFIASVRRSYLQFLFQAIGLPFRPNYWDYQYKLTHKLNAYNSISFLGIGSIDDFSVEAPDSFDAEQRAQLEQAPFINQKTNTIGLSWKNRFKSGTGFMQTTLSMNSLNNEFTRYENPESEQGVLFNNDALETEVKLRYSITKFYKEWKFKAGSNLQHSHYTNRTVNVMDSFNFNTELNFFKYGIFANGSRSYFNDKLDVSLGFRMDGDSFTNTDLLSTFSPRLSLSYLFLPNWRLSASIGRYFKLPPYTILGFKDESNKLVHENIDYTQSNHYVLGLQYSYSKSSLIALEGFYKRYKNYPVSALDGVSLANKGGGFEVLGNEAIQATGLGRAYGLEFQFQQKLTNNFYGIFAYTWFYSQFSGLNPEDYKPSVWDSRHLISFTGGYQFLNNWELSARYRFAGETPFVPTDIEATETAYPEIVLDYDRLGTENLDVFSQLDIRLDKKWNFKNWAFNVFIEAQNVLSQNNPQPPQYGLARSNNGTVQSPRRLVEIETDNSQIIPSIGIVLDF